MAAPKSGGRTVIEGIVARPWCLQRKSLPWTDPDSQEAMEFLYLAEGGEVTHYEVLSAMTKGIEIKSSQ